jgi:hypothetical protein
MKKQEFNTVQAIAAVIRAFQENGNEINRTSYVNNENKAIRSNQEIAAEFLKDPASLADYIQQAEDDISYFKQSRLISTLKGNKVSNFMATVNEILAGETVIGSLGYLVWFPRLVAQMRKHDASHEQWAMNAPHSKWVAGKIGEKVTLSFRMLENRFLKNHGFWVVTGITDEGNIVSYFTNTENKIVERGTITGKIKGHNIDKYRCDAKTTMLNYVRFV